MEGDPAAIRVTSFSDHLIDTTVHFQVMRLKGAWYFWVGTDDAAMRHLDVAFVTKEVCCTRPADSPADTGG